MKAQLAGGVVTASSAGVWSLAPFTRRDCAFTHKANVRLYA
jgi:hypothetical protein